MSTKVSTGFGWLEDDVTGDPAGVRRHSDGKEFTIPLVETYPVTGGLRIPILRTSTRDRLADVLEWCRPVHVPILDPLRFVGMSPVTSDALTLSHNPSASEFPGSSFKLSISSAGTTSVNIVFPSSMDAGVSSPVRVGPRIHARVKCSDWSKVSGFWIDFLTDGSVSKKYRWPFISSGKSLYGITDPAYSSAWNGKYRTFIMDSDGMTAVGSPSNLWGRNKKYLPCTGISFSAVCTAAVEFEVTRIYCPEWPVGVFAPIFDGWYSTARDYALKEFAPRGWGCGGSVVQTNGQNSHPLESDLPPLINAGFDVFMHGHATTAEGVLTPMTSSISRADMLRNHAEVRSALLKISPFTAMGMQWHQWLTNAGTYNGSDLAGELRSLGIHAGRGYCSDAEFGIDPMNSTYTSSIERRYQSWASLRGRYNRDPCSFPAGMAAGANYNDPTNTGDSTYPTLMQRVAWAADNAEPLIAYTHRVQSTPTTLDSTPEFMAGLVADLEEKERAGKLLILSPTDLERLTYWRNDREGLFMRWDGEWVFRHDPTKIAF